MTGSSSSFRCSALGLVLFFSAAFGLPQQNHLRVSDSSSNGTRAVDSLKFVGIVASHGNVAPTFDYSANPYPANDTEYWPFGAGEVTTVGRNELYALGLNIRKMYNGFVDEEYSDSDFAPNSPEVDRSTISAQLFTAGLYPPVDYEIWNTDLLWQPILVDVDSSDKSLDVASCDRFVEESNKTVSDFESKYASTISSLKTYLSSSTGASIEGVQDIASVWEMLYSQSVEGLDAISWATNDYLKKMKKLTGQYYIEYFAGSDESVKLVIGTLFEEILTAMKDQESASKVNKYQQEFVSQVEDGPGPNPTGGFGPNPTGGFGPHPTGGFGPNPTGGFGPMPFSSNEKMEFYSGYNASLIALQAVLGIPSSSIVSPVRPGSAMVFELHENATSQDYYVQVLWLDGGISSASPSIIDIPSCGTSCDLTTFTSMTEKFSNMTSYSSECQSTSASSMAKLL